MKITKIFLILLCLFFTLDSLVAMEQQEPSQPSQTVQAPDAKKKRRKKKHTKKKKQEGEEKEKEHEEQAEEPKSQLPTPLLPTYVTSQELAKRIAEINAQNLPQLLHVDIAIQKGKEDYLRDLQVLASMLVVTEHLADILQKVTEADSQALATAHKLHSIKGFAYEDKPSIIEDTPQGCVVISQETGERTLLGDVYAVTSPNAKAAILQAQTFFKDEEEKITKQFRNFEPQKQFNYKLSLLKNLSRSQFISTLAHSSHPELLLISSWFQNMIAQDERSVYLSEAFNIFKILVYMKAHLPLEQWKSVRIDTNAFPILKQTTEDGQIIPVIEEWLKRPKLDSFITTYIPHFCNLMETFGQAINEADLLNPTDMTPGSEYIDYKRDLRLNALLQHMLTTINANKDNYKRLYALLYSTLTNYFKDKKNPHRIKWRKQYETAILNSEDVQNPLPVSIFAEKAQQKAVSEGEEWVAGAKKFAAAGKKAEQQRKQAAQQKQKLQRQQQRQKQVQQLPEEGEGKEPVPEYLEAEIVEPLSLELLEHPTQQPNIHKYDNRCLRWFFDRDFLADKKPPQILYHTFDLAADHIIFENGIQQQHEKRSGQSDTSYLMGGEVHYPHGRKITVLFACTKDPKGICYHRGFQKTDNLFAEFQESKFNYDFPAEFQRTPSETKKVAFEFGPELYSTTYLENPFYYEIHDKRNHVTLILFKPTFGELHSAQ